MLIGVLPSRDMWSAGPKLVAGGGPGGRVRRTRDFRSFPAAVAPLQAQRLRSCQDSEQNPLGCRLALRERDGRLGACSGEDAIAGRPSRRLEVPATPRGRRRDRHRAAPACDCFRPATGHEAPIGAIGRRCQRLGQAGMAGERSDCAGFQRSEITN